jgi:excisionase family DNA binding protein
MENPFQVFKNDLNEIKYLISKLNLVQTKEEPEADILNVQEAAKLLNLAPATIYNKVNKKEIPHFKKGKKLWFSKTGLIAWLKEGKKLTIIEIQKEAIETLSKQKKSEFKLKDNRPSLPERVKLFTKTADLEDQTPEEASKEAGDIHYHISKDELNKDNV